MTIKDLIQFSDLMHRFREIERVIHINGQNRNENDTEHSYMLAMLAWHICSTEKLKLDLAKVITYALAHDLVEVYAGDTFLYSKDKKLHQSKKKRESDAAKRLAKEFPHFKELHKAIHNFEEQKDPESKFVYALDKLQPVIMIYLDHGYDWKKAEVTLDMIKKKKESKMGQSPEIKKYWDELLKILEKEEGKLFPRKNQ